MQLMMGQQVGQMAHMHRRDPAAGARMVPQAMAISASLGPQGPQGPPGPMGFSGSSGYQGPTGGPNRNTDAYDVSAFANVNRDKFANKYAVR